MRPRAGGGALRSPAEPCVEEDQRGLPGPGELHPGDARAGVARDHEAPGGAEGRSSPSYVGPGSPMFPTPSTSRAGGEPDPAVVGTDHDAVVGEVELDHRAVRGDRPPAVVDRRALGLGQRAGVDHLGPRAGRGRGGAGVVGQGGRSTEPATTAAHGGGGGEHRGGSRAPGTTTGGRAARRTAEGRSGRPAREAGPGQHDGPPSRRADRPAGLAPATAGTSPCLRGSRSAATSAMPRSAR